VVLAPAGQDSASAPAGRPAAAEPAAVLVSDLVAALGVGPEALDAPAPALDGEEVAAAALVRLHFHAHRPDPAAFPRVALRILELAAEPEADLAELSRAIELDPAVAAGVLAHANSATARALDPIETVAHAVTRLGLAEVARVAAAVSLRSLYDVQVGAGFQAFVPLWPQLFRHAVVTARLASGLARGRPDVDPQLAYLAGLLHDVGLAVSMRSLTALTLDATLPMREPASASRILHAVHVEVGAEAQRGWRLPGRLRLVAARHHERALPPGSPLAPVHLVKLASALDLLRVAPQAHPRAAAEVVEAAQALALTPAALAVAVVRHGDAVAWATRCFSQA
jgi:putative nucleotidyltransferase with HDIG domain